MTFRRATVRPLPDGLPELRGGRHHSPKQGSCLMEYVSVLAGEPFSDRPAGTAPVLARLARQANDRLEKEIGTGRRTRDVRRELLPLAPALANTEPDHVVRPVVLDHLTATGLALAPHDRSLQRLRRHVLAFRLGLGGPAHRAWLRARMAAGTEATFVRVEALLQDLRPVQRNAEWIGLLKDVVGDLTGGVTPSRTPAMAA